jgi:cell division protein ZipA
MGMFHFSDPRTGDNRFTMANRFEPGSFELDRLDQFSTRGLTLFMNVPRVSDPSKVFGELVSVAEYAASELAGELQDPDGNAIDQSGFEQIRQQISSLGETLTRAGIIPGSEEALRLF